MRYIKKTNAPGNVRRELTKKKSSMEWKKIPKQNTAAIRIQFDLLSKRAIREALLKNQQYLCAYCMKRIQNHELHMTIEHFVPLSKSKDKALDFDNMLGTCKGGADILIKGKRILCCDGSKKDEEEMTIDPCNKEMMAQIAYYKDGTIYFKSSKSWNANVVKQIEQDINFTLCLNGKLDANGAVIADTATNLIKGRRDAYEQAVQIEKRLAYKGQLTSLQIMKVLKKMQEKETLPEFAGTIMFFLMRKYKALLAQGK